jgi:hypothetical protein
MDSWRIKVQNFDRSQVPAVAERKSGAMVIKAPKGPNTPMRFPKGSSDYIRDTFGDPSPAYPQIWEALEYNQYGPIWLSSPYAVADGKEDLLPGVMVTSTAVTAFPIAFGPIPAEVEDGTYVVDGELELFAVLAKSPYAGGDLAISVQHKMNPLAPTEHLFAMQVYKKNSVDEWVLVENYSELSFSEEAKNAAGTRIYMPIRLAKSKYVRVILKDIVTWPATITLTSTDAVTIAGGKRTDIDLLGEIQGELLTPEILVDFDTHSTFTETLLTDQAAAALTLDQLYESVAGTTYYTIVPTDTEEPIDPIDFDSHATFSETKLTTLQAVTDAIAANPGSIYKIEQNQLNVYGPSTPTFDLAAKKALIVSCWEAYKKKALYPADLFMDDTGYPEIATAFDVLRKTAQKYSYYLHKVPYGASEVFSDLETTMEGVYAGIDQVGMAYFVNDAYVYDAYTGKEYWTSLIGRIGVKYAAMEDIFDGLAPAGIDERGHGGLLSVVGSGPHIKKLRHYFTDPEDELLDGMGVNPVLMDTGYGAYIGGQKTAQNPKKLTDYSYVNFARATDYIRRNIVQRGLVQQLWKLMDANHRFQVISACNAVIAPVIQAGILDDAVAFVTATDETNAQRKFVLGVAVRTTPTAEYIDFNFTNVAQGVDVKSVIS